MQEGKHGNTGNNDARKSKKVFTKYYIVDTIETYQ